jgi:PAS domain S-box-containing protein
VKPLRPLSSLRRRLQFLGGVNCPVCVLAIVVAVALAGVSFGAILLDRIRTQQQASLTAKGVADIARQRTTDLFVRIDAALHAVEDAVPATPAWAGPFGEAARAEIDRVISQRRRAEPRLLALYLLDRSGNVMAGSATTATRGSVVVPACLGGERPDADQVVLHGVALDEAGGGLRGLCVVRGLRRDGFAGSVLAVVAGDLLAGQYADLSVGAHGAVVLLDENARPLVWMGTGRPVAVTSAGMPHPQPDWDSVMRGAGSDPVTGSIAEARRIEAPFGAVVAIVISPADVLASWQARALLVTSSALIVLMFLALSVIAVKTCERRERNRLDRIATLALGIDADTDQAVMLRQMADEACALIGCELVGADNIPPHDPARPPEVTLPRADRVRIGPHILQKRNGRGFSLADLTLLTIISRIAAIQTGASGRLADVETTMAELRAAGDRYRQTAEAILLEMPDATFTLDGDWRFLSTNRNADKLFGEYAEDIRGRAIWDVFPELEGTIFESECRRALAGRHSADFEMKWLRTETWLLVNVHPRGNGLVVYLQDISRQVATDDKLRQVAKMEAIGRLTGGIAHDFNNLLTVILGNVDMLTADIPESGEAREMLDQVRRAAQSAADLTHQLLAFARRQPLSPSEVDVGRLVVGLDGLLRRTLGAAVSLDIRCSPSLWRARVDPTQLENAIVNLAINARDAIPAGRIGRLGIEATNIAIRKPDIDQFGELRPGNYVVVSVSDNGGGIPRDLLGKVFEPFFTTKPAGRGTGLGLAMVYGFVTQSGGHVRIVSDEGRGTTVRLYLPALAEARTEPAAPTANAARTPEEPAAPEARGERILVVEDSDMVRGYTRNVLAGLGYDVISAADGAEALALIDRGVRPDLLLTDVLLPGGMDGLQVAVQVLRRLPGLPVIYMSGYVENIDLAKSGLEPQVNLLLKPFRRAALAAIVRARLDGAAVR